MQCAANIILWLTFARRKTKIFSVYLNNGCVDGRPFVLEVPLKRAKPFKAGRLCSGNKRRQHFRSISAAPDALGISLKFQVKSRISQDFDRHSRALLKVILNAGWYRGKKAFSSRRCNGYICGILLYKLSGRLHRRADLPDRMCRHPQGKPGRAKKRCAIAQRVIANTG